MKARYIAIYKIQGVNSIITKSDRVVLLELTFPTLLATLTSSPEQDFLHIDRSAALLTQLFKSTFSPDKEGALEERLAAEIKEVKARRRKRAGKGVFLVLEGGTDVPASGFKARWISDEFGVSMDDLSKDEIRERFRLGAESMLTALSLCLPNNADRQIEKVGDVVYLIDADSGKPVYAFNLQAGSVRASVASLLTEIAITEAAALALRLSGQRNITRPASLLQFSLERATGQLQGFIAAWSALEIFVNATFKSAYESRWFLIMEDGAPASAKPVFERFREVMSDKYRLADKFLVIASVLDPATATIDASEFRRLKKQRDELLHTSEIPSSPLPTEDVQKLLLKYMKLHLASAQ